MDQRTFANLEYRDKRRKTRREAFLGRMDTLIPWERLEELIRPHYPFRMKLHIGTDSETDLVHSIATTSANVDDVTQAHGL